MSSPSFPVAALPGPSRRFRRRVRIAALALLGLLGAPALAHAQSGTGGSAGGGLTSSDFFISVQRELDVNLTDYEAAQYLNQANCLCKRPLWIKAILLPSASARAATISPSASVSIRIGNQCDVSTERRCCNVLKDAVSFSDFRISGIVGATDVETVSHIYSSSNRCGAVTTPDPTDPTSGTSSEGCYGPRFDQTVWVFVSTTGGDTPDIVASSKLSIDPEPPPAPTGLTLSPANEALLLDWTAVPSSSVPDLLGYQVLCSRAADLQVFRDGTYSPWFDSCPSAFPGDTPVSRLDSRFACSGLLSATDYRLKILQNGIFYGVAVAAIDKQRNASYVEPSYEKPVATKDFYYEYRHGDPQGGSAGGFCAVAGSGAASARDGALAALVAAGAVGLALTTRRRRPGRRHRRHR